MYVDSNSAFRPEEVDKSQTEQEQGSTRTPQAAIGQQTSYILVPPAGLAVTCPTNEDGCMVSLCVVNI